MGHGSGGTHLASSDAERLIRRPTPLPARSVATAQNASSTKELLARQRRTTPQEVNTYGCAKREGETTEAVQGRVVRPPARRRLQAAHQVVRHEEGGRRPRRPSQEDD